MRNIFFPHPSQLASKICEGFNLPFLVLESQFNFLEKKLFAIPVASLFADATKYLSLPHQLQV